MALFRQIPQEVRWTVAMGFVPTIASAAASSRTESIVQRLSRDGLDEPLRSKSAGDDN